MRQIVIASHHRFAEGMQATLEFVGGDLNIRSICAYVDDASLEKQIEDIFTSFDENDELLILTDMMQGSVNQAFLRYLNERTFLVAGVNFPCALELALSTEPLNHEFIHGCIVRAREQMVLINDLPLVEQDFDE